MLCENCHKNEANTTVTQFINGDMSVSHLCSECASKLGMDFSFPSLNNMLSNFFTDFAPFAARPVARCSLCGASYEEFARSGKAGCANCYTTFYDQLLPSLQRIHGKTRHNGKIPGSSGNRARIINKIEQLKMQLNDAISKQEFEEAAKLRDQINALEKEASDNGKEL